MKTIVALTGFALLSVAYGACPNSCSGHGTCGFNDKCTCFARWSGPSCEERQCPYGLSWVSTSDNSEGPAGGDLSGAHAYTSCSSRGKCGDDGQCECYPGYEGRGCRRSNCPNDCSGHGRCMKNSEINGAYGTFVDFNSQYWDGEMTRQCVCDPGYEGYDCSNRMCPRGDDPLTECTPHHRNEPQPSSEGTSQNDVQLIQYDVSTGGGQDFTTGYFTLTFTDMYGAEYTTHPIKAEASGADTCNAIKVGLENLPNFAVPNVTVTATVASNIYECAVEFVDNGNSGQQNTLRFNAGSDHGDANMQPRFMTATFGDASTLPSPYYKVSHDQTHWDAEDTYEEHMECSGRGACDHSTGVCSCYDGFTGESCHQQTVFF